MAKKKITKFKLKSGPGEFDFFYALARLHRVVFYFDGKDGYLDVCITSIKRDTKADFAQGTEGKVWEFSGFTNGEEFGHSRNSHVEGQINYAESHPNNGSPDRDDGITGWIKISD